MLSTLTLKAGADRMDPAGLNPLAELVTKRRPAFPPLARTANPFSTADGALEDGLPRHIDGQPVRLVLSKIPSAAY